MKKISICSIEKILLVLTLFFIFIFNYSDNKIFINLTNFFIILFCTIEFLKMIRHKYLLVNKGIFSLLSFLLFCIISIIGSYNVPDSVEKVKTLLVLFLFLISILNFIKKKENFHFFIISISIISIISCLYIIFNYDWGNRATGIIGDSNQVSAYLAYSAILLILCYKEKLIIPFLLYIGLILITFVIIISGSRSGLVVLLVGMFLSFFNFSNKTWKDVLKKLIIVIVFFIFLVYLYNFIMTNEVFYKLIGSRYISFFEILSGKASSINEQSTNTRIIMLNLAWAKFIESPKTLLLGNGIGYFASYFQTFNGGWYAFCHNNYLELLSGIGILGFLSYYYIYFKYLLFYCSKQIRRINHYYKTGMIIVLQILLMHWFVVFYYQKLEYLFIAIIIYLLFIRSEEYDKN